jgi:hypothetical protein
MLDRIGPFGVLARMDAIQAQNKGEFFFVIYANPVAWAHFIGDIDDISTITLAQQ